MTVKVLVVDDSAFFRQRITNILSQDTNISVVGTARDGLDAIEKNKSLSPDVITMDVEMPKLNGIDAVRQIMREKPTQILMVSSLTHEGAQVTLQSMDAGAVDYLTKDMRAWMDKSPSLNKELLDKIIALGKSKYLVKSNFLNQPRREETVFQAQLAVNKKPNKQSSAVNVSFGVKIVAIGSSTGGPAALQEILTKLPRSFPYPILLIQHMPNTFTSVFAERLNQQCEIDIKQAESGDVLERGKAFLAPGGQQMIIDSNGIIQVLAGSEELTYKPSVDITFASVAKKFGSRCLGIILTGMGADGTEGAKLLKTAGASVWAQSEETCTIYGMPQAAVKAGVVDHIVDLNDFAQNLNSNSRN